MRRIPRLSTTTARAKVVIGVLIGLLAATIGAVLRGTHAIEGMERRVVDARTNAYLGSRPADPRIVLAVVEEADLAALKKLEMDWPWELEATAFAFRWMQEAGVAAVMVDVLQFDKGTGPEEISHASDNQLESVRSKVKEVLTLMAAYQGLKDHAAIVLGMRLLAAGEQQMDPKAAEARGPVFDEMLRRLPPLRVVPAFARDRVWLPVVRLLQSSSQVGFVNAAPDDDGVLRRVVPLARVGGRVLPSLPLATAIELRLPVGVEGRGIRTGAAEQRLDESGAFLANFRGRGASYAEVRPADMVQAGASIDAWDKGGRQGPLPELGSATVAAVKGKIVVWGVNAPGFKDVVSAPVSDRFAGPEFQATALDNLLNGDGRVAADGSTNLAILFALCVLLGAVSIPIPRGALAGVWLVLTGGLVLAAYRLFLGGLSIDLVTPTVGLTGTYAGSIAFRLLTEGRRNKWLEGTFSQYLSPAVIDALKSDPTMLQLTGKKREITVLFSDVKGFTSISEKLPPEQLTVLLNDYLTRQSDPILERDGVIDKFIGDAVMAFFGDPVPAPDHALRACRAAVACRVALAGTAPLAASFGVEVTNRIGVNSGQASMGNMGSAKRLSYTAMGDTVNLASRLESANKVFGSGILIGPLTYEQAKDAIVSRPIARLVVVGKKDPMAVHELLGIAGETDATTLALAAAYARAHAAILADELVAARRHLVEALGIRPDDGPTMWLARLLDELEAWERSRPWDGVFVLDEK